MVDVVLDVDVEVLLEEVVLDDVVVDVDELDVLLLDVEDEVLLDDVDDEVLLDDVDELDVLLLDDVDELDVLLLDVEDEVLLDDVDVLDDDDATLVEVADVVAFGELVNVADRVATDVVAESTSDSGVTLVDDVDCSVVDSVVGEGVVSTMLLSLVESTTDSCWLFVDSISGCSSIAAPSAHPATSNAMMTGGHHSSVFRT